MQRWDIDGRRVKPDAVIGFVLGLVVAYLVQRLMGLSPIAGSGPIFTTIIVTAVAGAWYHFRKVL